MKVEMTKMIRSCWTRNAREWWHCSALATHPQVSCSALASMTGEKHHKINTAASHHTSCPCYGDAKEKKLWRKEIKEGKERQVHIRIDLRTYHNVKHMKNITQSEYLNWRVGQTGLSYLAKLGSSAVGVKNCQASPHS